MEGLLTNIWSADFLGNPVSSWIWGIALFLAIYAGLQLVKRLLTHRFRDFVLKTQTHADNLILAVLLKTQTWVMLLLSLYVGTFMLTLPDNVSRWMGVAAFTIFLIQAGVWGDALIRNWLIQYRTENLEEQADDVTTIKAVSFVVRLLLFSVLILLALDNIPGIEVTSLVASLGIGGIAVALAVQNILADLFASLSIALDKPFVIGDFIIVGDHLGTVEHIGLKTTRLRSLSGEELVISNADLLNSRIRNYKRMQERRISFSVGVTYETTHEQLKRIPEIIETIVSSLDDVRFDRAHLKAFGDFSLNFEVVYYVLGADYNLYMDIQQAINLALFRKFAAEGIEFAYPTQTLHFKHESQLSGNNVKAIRQQG